MISCACADAPAELRLTLEHCLKLVCVRLDWNEAVYLRLHFRETNWIEPRRDLRDVVLTSGPACCFTAISRTIVRELLHAS